MSEERFKNFPSIIFSDDVLEGLVVKRCSKA